MHHIIVKNHNQNKNNTLNTKSEMQDRSKSQLNDNMYHTCMWVKNSCVTEIKDEKIDDSFKSNILKHKYFVKMIPQFMHKPQ